MRPITPSNPLGAGRSSKLTPELIEEACKVLALGNYIKTTCGYLGISEGIWRVWHNDGERLKSLQESGETLTEDEQLRVDFYVNTQQAKDKAIIRDMQLIQNAAQNNWQAAAWVLERRYPDMFSLVQRITVNAQPAQLTHEEIKRQLQERKMTIDAHPMKLINDSNKEETGNEDC